MRLLSFIDTDALVTGVESILKTFDVSTSTPEQLDLMSKGLKELQDEVTSRLQDRLLLSEHWKLRWIDVEVATVRAAIDFQKASLGLYVLGSNQQALY